ncbi:MAG TPA: hypothetical protein VKB49_03920 [Candidatus Sulfotelmatobacter sp.]|nr:hypothetical protein [Candidatus Sulfotelmatobacter sp.]
MKKFAFYAIAFICVSSAANVVSQAQTVGLKVNIPFNFNIEENVLPAGQYLILAPQGGTLRIEGPDGAAALAMTNPVIGTRPEGAGALSFRCYGHRCFLFQFWSARTETGQQVSKCRLEKELAGEKEQLALITLRGTVSQ